MRILSLLTITLTLACDAGECRDTDGVNVVTEGPMGPDPMTELPTTTMDPVDPPGVDPTEGPPERVCGPIKTNPEAACGLVCVDELGIELVVLCELGGGWECKLYPRKGPIIGETYKKRPVWCGKEQ